MPLFGSNLKPIGKFVRKLLMKKKFQHDPLYAFRRLQANNGYCQIIQHTINFEKYFYEQTQEVVSTIILDPIAVFCFIERTNRIAAT